MLEKKNFFSFLYHGTKLVEKTQKKFTKVRIFDLVPECSKKVPSIFMTFSISVRPTRYSLNKKFLKMVAGKKYGGIRYLH